MSKEKVTYIISDIDRAVAFEWIATYINKDKFTLSFILLNPGSSALEAFLKDLRLEVHSVLCRGKRDWPTAIFKVYSLLRAIRPKVVHCHLIQANTIGLVAARLAGINKRIYTRHHSSLHHVYFPKGVWWDRLANKLATDIVAISAIVKTILIDWEHVLPGKVKLIPHGFMIDQYTNVDTDAVEDFKSKYDLRGNYPIIGVVSRLTEWKGVQYIVSAFKQLLTTYPESILLLLNAHGDYEATILKQLERLPKNSYRLIRFEKNIAAAYKVMDVFVHVPIDEHSEAFGQIYIEALAAGTPSVFTRSGIANAPEFNDQIASIVPYKDSTAIFSSIQSILSNKTIITEKRIAGQKLASKFDFPSFINQLEKIYSL